MINFEYGGYSFNYNEFQHKLEVSSSDKKLLFDNVNFDLGKMLDIYHHLDEYFRFGYYVDKLGGVLDELRENCLSLEKLEETEEVYEFLEQERNYLRNEVEVLLEGL